MVICCDTSFLFALYGDDCHTQAAMDWMTAAKAPITITALNEFELLNALRLSEFRKLLAPGKVAQFVDQFHRDVEAGFLVNHPCNLAQVIETAGNLSESHTVHRGHRSFDILHVAGALHLKATIFLTFDRNQQRLAEAQGLRVAGLVE